MTSLKDVLGNINIETTEEEAGMKHRSKGVMERPKEEVELKAVSLEDMGYKKTQKDPTPDLISVPNGMTDSEYQAFICEKEIQPEQGYAVWCQDTYDLWYAKDKLCLDQNFIFREDLRIEPLSGENGLQAIYKETAGSYSADMLIRKTCYILDSPAAETYEVYYETAYPSIKYGKATPNGMFIHKYLNRFHRDMAIMELDKMYTDESKKTASALTKKPMRADEAIIVSDGAWMKNVCSSAHYYLDMDKLIKMTQGFLPSEGEQAVLISEIQGATNALQMCRINGKKNIKYYYDNTSILNVFRNRKTEYIREVKEYKELLQEMDKEGYSVSFIELHPKTGEDRAEANKGLMFFHNYCDKECREMADIFAKKYADIAKSADDKGVGYKSVQPKPKRPQNNSRNGNNRYQRRY